MSRSVLFEKLAIQAPHLSTKQVLPAFIYGTAWKKDDTADLVYQAISNGFTAIDTAAQPKHYREDLVADGVAKAIKEGGIKRSDLYLQTKFTSIQGQDQNNMPYDPKSSLSEQVNDSVLSSLRNFNFAHVMSEDDSPTSYIDTLVLHSPMPSIQETLEVWQTLEQFVPREIRNLGISNCNLFTLMDLYERAWVKPAIVQNRFYPSTKYDIGVRKFCQEKGIIYQSFWTLTANPRLLSSAQVRDLANRLEISPSTALYCLVLSLGNTVVLNGTTNVQRMQEDWTAIQKASNYGSSHPKEWESCVQAFKKLLGQSMS